MVEKRNTKQRKINLKDGDAELDEIQLSGPKNEETKGTGSDEDETVS